MQFKCLLSPSGLLRIVCLLFTLIILVLNLRPQSCVEAVCPTALARLRIAPLQRHSTLSSNQPLLNRGSHISTY